MADEDEIDILGDFTLDNLLSKNEVEIYDNADLVSNNSDVLSWDCSSQWLLDQAATSSQSNCWVSDFCTNLSVPDLSVDTSFNCNDHQISIDSTISDASGWTKNEKNLLDRGIEIFGKSPLRLSQFVGSKSSSEVKYYLKHFYVNTHFSCSSGDTICDGDVIEETVVLSDVIDHMPDENKLLDDSEIPASIEEVISAVSTAKHTIPVNSKKSRKNSHSKSGEIGVNYHNLPSGHSLLKRNIYKHIDDELSCAKSELNQLKQRTPENSTQLSQNDVKFKFHTKLKVPKNERRKFERRNATHTNDKNINVASFTKTIPNINGEEVVKMKKENSDEELESDLEIDVENINESVGTGSENSKQIDKISVEVHNRLNSLDKGNLDEVCLKVEAVTERKDDVLHTKSWMNMADLSEEVTKQLLSMEMPVNEQKLKANVITDMEKFINNEFFVGKPTKTAERYLKIRNHILNMWSVSKPQYVTKTSIRPGLRNCGDVNSIGRVHQFLEQIGAINFGCSQTIYIRPLYKMVLSSSTQTKEKSAKDVYVSFSRDATTNRARIKRKFTNDGEGGCTLIHNENGEVINTTVVNEEPIIKQHRSYIKKPSIRLIYCKPFTDNHPQKYKVSLHLSALILMDLHAHMSPTEVMGLIGGYWDPELKTLTISRYVPCRNIAPSTTHCDMCPISQIKAADLIHNEYLDILGWFHSHPTFAPEPSQQDLDTQLSVQTWIGYNKPCTGIILSPFNIQGALIASPYKCLMVDKKHNFDDKYVPYKFKVELEYSTLDVDVLLNQAWRVFNTDCNISVTEKIDFSKAYFLDESITHLDKFISSVKMHLAKCSNINKMTCDTIVEGFSRICCNRL